MIARKPKKPEANQPHQGHVSSDEVGAILQELMDAVVAAQNILGREAAKEADYRNHPFFELWVYPKFKEDFVMLVFIQQDHNVAYLHVLDYKRPDSLQKELFGDLGNTVTDLGLQILQLEKWLEGKKHQMEIMIRFGGKEGEEASHLVS